MKASLVYSTSCKLFWVKIQWQLFLKLNCSKFRTPFKSRTSSHAPLHPHHTAPLSVSQYTPLTVQRQEELPLIKWLKKEKSRHGHQQHHCHSWPCSTSRPCISAPGYILRFQSLHFTGTSPPSAVQPSFLQRFEINLWLISQGESVNLEGFLPSTHSALKPALTWNP